MEVEIVVCDGTVGRASVPSGASTGKAEAVELRDGGTAWAGYGVAKAVANVKRDFARALHGCDVLDQAGLDARLIEADGTPNFAHLGANAAIAVSLAAVRAGANFLRQPLYRRIAQLAEVEPLLPMPMVNILSGGLHAGRGMDVQDFLVVPVGASGFSEALEWVCRVRASAAALCTERAIGTLLADEGGLSPGFERTEEALALMVAAFDRAGLAAGREVAIALDVASSSLQGRDGRYEFRRLGRTYGSAEMIALLRGWVQAFPIISVEDGLGEEDWSMWPALTRALGEIQLVGDDLLVTQSARIERAASSGSGNAALIKFNQNGTFSGTLKAVRAARAAGFATVISARSGETEDDFLADLAVGVAGGQIKIGSVRSSERLAKYNQLLRLEEQGLEWPGARPLASRRRFP